MEWIPYRLKLRVVAAAFAAIVLASALLVYERHTFYVNNPDVVTASSGMYAGGDLLLEFFIAGLLLVPTFLLVLVIRSSETAYTRYSQTLLGLSVTAPLCAGLFLIPAINQSNSLLGWFCMFRLFASPMIVIGLAMSRIFAPFRRAQRLSSYALLVEVGTFGSLVALFLLSTGTARG